MTRFSTIALRGTCAAAFALLIAAAPAQAERSAGSSDSTRTGQASGGSTSAQPAKATKYCISDQITGSRVAKKVCKTKEQWEAEGLDLTGK